MILTSLLIGAGAAILGGTGIAKGVKAVSDNSEANKIIMRAQGCVYSKKMLILWCGNTYIFIKI